MRMFVDIVSYAPYILLGIIVLHSIYILTKGWIPSVSLGSWRQPIEEFYYPTENFYGKLKGKIENCGIEGISMKMVTRREGNIFFSAKRLYFRITWKRRVIDVCAAPFGKGYFFSWWIFEKGPLWHYIILFIPVVGRQLLKLFTNPTYYKVDTSHMFQSMVHTQVVHLIDELLDESGSQALTAEQKKPLYRDLLKGL